MMIDGFKINIKSFNKIAEFIDLINIYNPKAICNTENAIVKIIKEALNNEISYCGMNDKWFIISSSKFINDLQLKRIIYQLIMEIIKKIIEYKHVEFKNIYEKRFYIFESYKKHKRLYIFESYKKQMIAEKVNESSFSHTNSTKDIKPDPSIILDDIVFPDKYPINIFENDFDPSKVTFPAVLYNPKHRLHLIVMKYNETFKTIKIQCAASNHPNLSHVSLISLIDIKKTKNKECGICLDHLLNNSCEYSFLACEHFCHFNCFKEYQKENDGEVICSRCQLNIKI